MFAAVEARCIPRLQLKAETLFLPDGELRVAALNLDFAYHGAPRDHAAERRARQVIEGFGAVELASLDDAEVMPGARVDYVLRIDGDVHALCAFAAYALPQLRQLMDMFGDFRSSLEAFSAALGAQAGAPAGYFDKFKSWEEVTLAVLMLRRAGKIWNGQAWVG